MTDIPEPGRDPARPADACSGQVRRLDLDWLRICAFALLILYHTGMFYVTWDWHVKSPRASDVIEPLMMLSSPWRLGLLFLVSGAATRFLSGRLAPAALAQNRVHRLLLPLLFGMFVVVPPQAYLEVVEKLGWTGSYPAFMGLYVQGYGGFCRSGDCLELPTWNHLWFVAYLLVYGLLLAALLAARPVLPRLPHLPDRLVVPLFVIGPWLWLWTMRALLFPRFDSTHALVDDWYNHSIYLPLFLLGFVIARSDRIAAATVRLRWIALVAFALGWSRLFLMDLSDRSPPMDLLLGRGLRELQAWGAILACLGFARLHLSGADGPARRWLTRAIFPFYIVHQTAIVVAAHLLARQALPLPLEAGLVLLATIAACVGAAMAAMAWPPLGAVLGVPPKRPLSPGRA